MELLDTGLLRAGEKSQHWLTRVDADGDEKSDETA